MRDEKRVPPSPAERAAEKVLDAVEDGLERAGKTDAAARARAATARPAFAAKVAAIIAEEYAPLVEALQTALGHGNCYCAECKALSARYWTPRTGDARRAALGSEGGR